MTRWLLLVAGVIAAVLAGVIRLPQLREQQGNPYDVTAQQQADGAITQPEELVSAPGEVAGESIVGLKRSGTRTPEGTVSLTLRPGPGKGTATAFVSPSQIVSTSHLEENDNPQTGHFQLHGGLWDDRDEIEVLPGSEIHVTSTSGNKDVWIEGVNVPTGGNWIA